MFIYDERIYMIQTATEDMEATVHVLRVDSETTMHDGTSVTENRWHELWSFGWVDNWLNDDWAYVRATEMASDIETEMASFLAGPNLWADDYLRQTSVTSKSLAPTQEVPAWMTLLESMQS